MIIGPMVWMTLAGLGLYLGYIPYNVVFFERLLASFHCKGNVGFLIYVADSIGYIGSVSVLIIKEFGHPGISWGTFFKQGVITIAIVGGTCVNTINVLFFTKRAQTEKDTSEIN